MGKMRRIASARRGYQAKEGYLLLNAKGGNREYFSPSNTAFPDRVEEGARGLKKVEIENFLGVWNSKKLRTSLKSTTLASRGTGAGICIVRLAYQAFPSH